ncbi:hypothetical protein ACFWUP_20780 [Nocardia sp. NPDC058658]|uniref:hypothetical protein n=1 Tax=Nocardia sp. NPDC058658 TaxID=3346580 RepID=UPI00366775AE
MADDDLLSVAPGSVLRDAVIEFVRQCGEKTPPVRTVDIVDSVFSAFQGAVVGPLPGRVPIDPGRQMMWGTVNGSPIELFDIRFLESAANVRDVRLTALQVTIVADLLRELAARLRPGAAFGLSATGVAMADFTDRIAEDLSARAPRPRPASDLDDWQSWLEGVEQVRDSDLRNAVVRLLDSLAEQGMGTEPVDEESVVEAFEALAGVVESDRPAGVPHGGDPGLFLRSVAGRTLLDEAIDIRARLAAEAESAESGDSTPDLVVLTAQVAFAAGILLKELAARLRPGITFGLLPMASELGIIAEDLAAELLAHTEYGRPTFYPGPTRLYVTAPDRVHPAPGHPGVMAPIDHLVSTDSTYIVPVQPLSLESMREYRELRESVLSLCEVLDDPNGFGADCLTAAEDIQHRIRGTLPATSSADPARHFLHFGTLTRHRTEPYGLTEFGRYVEESLVDPARTPYRPLELSPVEAAVVADLLDELSARLLPGAAFGIDSGGAPLAAVVADAASAFRARTDFRREIPAIPSGVPDTKYQRLRDAGIRWLDTFDENGNGLLTDPIATTALIDLYLVARDRPPRTDPSRTHPVRDPVSHLRSRLAHLDGRMLPVTLEGEASAIESLLATDSFDERHPAIRWPGLSGVHVSSMLGELALRLRPGPAFGPSNNGRALADIAHRLSEKIWNQVSPAT